MKKKPAGATDACQMVAHYIYNIIYICFLFKIDLWDVGVLVCGTSTMDHRPADPPPDRCAELEKELMKLQGQLKAIGGK